MPDVEPIIAIEVLLLLQMPPEVALVKVMVLLIPTVDGPPMSAGPAVTVTARVAKQPVSTYVMIATPADIPVTTPPEVTDAMAVELLVHVPPPEPAWVSVIEFPTHTVDGPDIVGMAPTVNTMLIDVVPTV
jgi:hypothetical protein